MYLVTFPPLVVSMQHKTKLVMLDFGSNLSRRSSWAPTVDLHQRRGRCTARRQHPPPHNQLEEAAEVEESRQTWAGHLEAEEEVE